MSQVKQTSVYKTGVNPDNSTVTTQDTTQTTKITGLMVAQRVVWFIVGVVDAILAIRFILLLLGANQSSEFVNFIYSITAPFVAPFVGIFGQPTYGSYMFEWSSLLAITIYSLVGLGIVKLLTISRPEEEI